MKTWIDITLDVAFGVSLVVYVANSWANRRAAKKKRRKALEVVWQLRNEGKSLGEASIEQLEIISKGLDS